MLRDLDTVVAHAASVAWTVKLKVPAPAGVPEMTPVPVLSVKTRRQRTARDRPGVGRHTAACRQRRGVSGILGAVRQ